MAAQLDHVVDVGGHHDHGAVLPQSGLGDLSIDRIPAPVQTGIHQQLRSRPRLLGEHLPRPRHPRESRPGKAGEESSARPSLVAYCTVHDSAQEPAIVPSTIAVKAVAASTPTITHCATPR